MEPSPLPDRIVPVMPEARTNREAPLCEACGYQLTGLAHDGEAAADRSSHEPTSPTPSPSSGELAGRCPECGRTIALSLPTRRSGSAVQRADGLWRAALATPGAAAAVLSTTSMAFGRFRRGGWPAVDDSHGPDPPERTSGQPAAVGATREAWAYRRGDGAVWGDLRDDAGRSVLFAAICLVAAGTVAWAGLSVSELGRSFFTPIALVGVIGETLLILGALTLIEWFGVQLIARKNGWRLTPGFAAAVCCHAAAGWLTSGVLFAVGWNVGHLFPLRSWLPWELPLPYGLTTPPAVLAAAGAFVGLLHYETLVWLGVVRCRFANGRAVTADSDAQAAPNDRA